MNTHLLYIDRNFDWTRNPTELEEEYIRNFGLDIMFHTMAGDDSFIYQNIKKVMTLSLCDQNEIVYRQDILKDCMDNPAMINKLWNIASTVSLKTEKLVNRSLISGYPKAVLEESMEMMKVYLEELKKIRDIILDHQSEFKSTGMKNFCNRTIETFPGTFFDEAAVFLHECRFRNGILLKGQPGKGNKTKDYSVINSREKESKTTGFLKKLRNEAFTFLIDESDTGSMNALSDIEQNGLSALASIVRQASEGISDFLLSLRKELAFYKGCLNLQDTLRIFHEPICFPDIDISPNRIYKFKELYDLSMVLTSKLHAVGNTLTLNQYRLLIITGANQGGKSTFLRSLGMAQVMMQCGMFVGAKTYTGFISKGIYSHFRNEEDADMKSGKFDEELRRLNKIIDCIKPGATIFLNESFAATNEKEGTEIARQVTNAFLEKGINICFVTHFYEYAISYYNLHRPGDIFLIAERSENGERTYRLIEGEPKRTSYGMDLYKSIFKNRQLKVYPFLLL